MDNQTPRQYRPTNNSMSDIRGSGPSPQPPRRPVFNDIQPVRPTPQAPSRPVPPPHQQAARMPQSVLHQASTYRQAPPVHPVDRPTQHQRTGSPANVQHHSSHTEQPRSFQPIGQPTQETTEKKPKKRSLFMIIFGGLIILSAAVNLLLLLSAARISGFSYLQNDLSLGVLAVMLLLGIGIILRKNLARKLYLGWAIILLGFAGYSTYDYIKNVSPLYQSAQASLLQSQQQLDWLKHTTTVPQAEVTELTQKRQAQETAAKQQVAKYQYTKLTIAEAYAAALIPALFLSTRSVRETFK